MPLLSDGELPSFTEYLATKLGHASSSQDPWLLAMREYLDEVGRRLNAKSRDQVDFWSLRRSMIAAVIAICMMIVLTGVLALVVFGSMTKVITDGWPVLMITFVAVIPLVIAFGIKRGGPPSP